jgi:AmmeMemoRadiSam system protein B/AmmeMemoRadiSam system protein A
MTATVAGGVRPAAVAGMFYPSDREALHALVAGLLGVAPDVPDPPGSPGSPGSPGPPKAVIAPHAGYRYSGATAGAAYRSLLPRRGQVERVVVMGPAHRVRVAGVGLCSARAWATPLGEIEVDVATCNRLSDLPGVVMADDAHAPEHSVEVQLPFVREVFGDVPIVPLVVGGTHPSKVAAVLDAVWGGPETAIVVSSDLSHYLDEASARARDQVTCTAIVEARTSDIGPHDACGFLPIGGLLTAGLHHGLAARPLELTTSADTAGEPERVVGYGSFTLAPPAPVGAESVGWLAELAARAIDHELRHGASYPLGQTEEVPDVVRSPGVSFVTLERGGDLVGCIGSLEPRRALWRDVARNARGAAFEDPRFTPLAAADRDGVTVEVSVLSPLEELPAPSPDAVAGELRPGDEGLVLASADRRSTFLPDVWDKIPEPDDFVTELARKARWPEPWPPGVRAWRYTTTSASTPL